jgi:hypothetical protein
MIQFLTGFLAGVGIATVGEFIRDRTSSALAWLVMIALYVVAFIGPIVTS